MTRNLAGLLVERLRRDDGTLAVAESFTGGLLMGSITGVPGASKVLRGGILAYTDESKRRLLGVPASLIRRHGAASEEVALAMAKGVRRALGGSIGIATTGVAGPSGGTRKAPVGLSIVAVASDEDSLVETRIHAGARIRVQRAGARQALTLLQALLALDPKRGPRRNR